MLDFDLSPPRLLALALILLAAWLSPSLLRREGVNLSMRSGDVYPFAIIALLFLAAVAVLSQHR